MATLFLLCGLPAAGKTTLAKQVERQRPALRLTPDEWLTHLFGSNLDAIRAPIEALQWEIAAQALTVGIDVVLDWGFWSRSERDDCRSRAAALGVRSEVIFLDVPLEELTRRLAARSAQRPRGTFDVTETELLLWARNFEPPSEDELMPR